MKILITGGLGYIGSHAVIEAAKANHNIVIVDNCINSDPKTHKILENYLKVKIDFYHKDVRDDKQIEEILKKHEIECVIHFAGLKSVSESGLKPLQYYDNNVVGCIKLLQAMKKQNVKKIIFSSSATVYGMPKSIPIQEDHELNPINVYGLTKKIIEELLFNYSQSHTNFGAVCLRYFNPVGAHTDNIVGETLNSEQNNIMPKILRVANEEEPYIEIFGRDYDTLDGTCIRDYVHVRDLAYGHVSAINFLQNNSGYYSVNLGTGKGVSVLELIKLFQSINKVNIPYEFSARRNGDTPVSIACPKYAKKLLNWETSLNIDDMCRDAWSWKQFNDKT